MKILSPLIGTFAALVLGSLPLHAQGADNHIPPEVEFTLTATSSIQIPVFGTTSSRVTVGEAKSQGLPAESGFIIESVKENGTAASLGLKAKDIVTHIEGRPVKNSLVGSLDQYIANLFFTDEEINVSWLRDGVASSANAKLSNKENAAMEIPKEENPLAELQTGLYKLTADAENVTTIEVGKGHHIQFKNDDVTITKPDGTTVFTKEAFSIDKHINEVPAEYRSFVEMFGKLNRSRKPGESLFTAFVNQVTGTSPEQPEKKDR